MDYDVLIIGAGVSGLAAARDASRAGLRVQILEGRAIIGGRVQTDESTGMDVGASWIHGHVGNPVYEEMRRSGVAMKAFNYENSQMYDHAGEVTDATEERIESIYEPIDDMVESKCVALARKAKGGRCSEAEGVPLQEVIEEAMAKSGVDTPATRNAVDFMVATEVVHEFGADPHELCAAHYDEGEDLKGNDYVMPGGGFAQFPALLAKDLPPGCAIATGVIVTDIIYGSDSGGLVRVRTAAGEEHRARACIVTVPLGVLKASCAPPAEARGRALSPAVAAPARAHSIAFHPPLPGTHAAAVHRLGMGTLNKYIVDFGPAGAIPWPARVDLFQYVDWPACVSAADLRGGGGGGGGGGGSGGARRRAAAAACGSDDEGEGEGEGGGGGGRRGGRGRGRHGGGGAAGGAGAEDDERRAPSPARGYAGGAGSGAAGAAGAAGGAVARPFAEMVNWARVEPSRRVLMAFAAGSMARRLTATPEGEVRRLLLEQLRAMFGRHLPEPKAFHRTAWDADPFAGGSYSFIAAGSSPADRAVLQQPIGMPAGAAGSSPEAVLARAKDWAEEGDDVNRAAACHAAGPGCLWFAGEHTSVDYPATVQGAFLSGKSAAAAVIAALR